MENWAQKIPQVHFLCVCVESKQVAVAFHQMFQFRHATNGYIPSQHYMPRGYGQLGCSGFIVSDKEGYFISRKTRAYLEYGDHAFENVESLLAPLITDPSESKKAKQGDVSVPAVVGATVAPKIEFDANKKFEAPASVGVDSMDDEHKECTELFNSVLKNLSGKDLQKLFDILKSHFEHEEELMKKYFGNNNSTSFSALDSHIMDHKRILNIASSELERVNGCQLKGK